MKIYKGIFLLVILLVTTFVLYSTNYSQTDTKSFEKLKSYYTKLSIEKGAEYAFAKLQVASVPPNTDLHLLGHVIGDILYKQQGAEGIKFCTQDFRNACSHSIVIGLFTDKGEKALIDIQQACKSAPGGKGAYIMCYHGLGHGILAYTGYDFPKTIELCQKTSSAENSNQEYPECVSGAVMEIISGGGHDNHLWQIQRPKYLKIDHPLYICSAEFMPEEARGRCYDYLTPFFWESIGADINSPNDSDFAKSFKLCEKIPEKEYQQICAGGFGKEFVAMAGSKDIRRVDQMSKEKLNKVVNWCQLANKDNIEACLLSALSSIFWGGENDYRVSIKFCNTIQDLDNNRACFLSLIGQISYFIEDPKLKNSICQDLPSQYIMECREELTYVKDKP